LNSAYTLIILPNILVTIPDAVPPAPQLDDAMMLVSFLRRLVCSLCVLLFLAPTVLHAQSVYTVRGTIVDAGDASPLPGATVRIAGTTLGAAANVEGDFSFAARLNPGDYTLRVSFVGYRTTEQSIALGETETVDVGTIELEADIIRSEEIVVTGAGVPTERRQLGTSISTVSAQELEQAPAVSIDRALQGKIAGANIQQNSGDAAGGISVRLRGASTVLGEADPLIIVDGVIVSNDSPELIDIGGGSQNRLLDIDPKDIERIEVVKGAAAAALYGSRANNGVVQIFTKRGRVGEPRVTFSSSVQTSNARKTLDVNRAQNEQGQFIDNSGDPLPEGQGRFDFQDFIFDRAWGTEQYLSASGGREATRYFFSGSHFANQGIIEGNAFRRLNGRARIDQTLTDWASVSAGAYFVFSESEDVPNGGVAANYGSLTGFLFGPNTFDPRPNEFGEYPGQTVLANPVEVIDRFDFGNETRRFTGSAQVDLTPLDALSINYTLGVDTYEQVGLAFIPRGTTAPGLGTGLSRRSAQGFLQINNDLTARYAAEIRDGLTSTTLVGGSLQYETTERFNGQSENLPPLVETSGSGSDRRDFGETRVPFTLYGVFGQQTFGVADRLFLTGALRLDASSSFGEGERWQLFPKVSSSYVVSEESFWQDSPLASIVPSFKLRAALGFSGGLTSINSFERFTPYSPTTFGNNPALIPPFELGAVDVKPERQREFELGADASLLEDRLAVEFTYYNQRTTDLLLDRNLAPTSGFSSRLGNIGTLDNAGIEILLRAIPVARPDVRWTSTVTFARNRNELSDLEQDIITFPRSFGGISAARNGDPIGIYFGSAFQRNDAGDIVDQNGNPLERDDGGFLRLQEGDPTDAGDGIPQRAFLDENDNGIRDPGEPLAPNEIIGDPNPNWTGSWINEIQLFQNFSIYAQLDAVVGQDVFNFTRRLGAFGAFGTLEDYERELEGDLPSGYNSAVFGVFENWVEDGSFVKLREVALTYTIQPDGLPLRSVQLKVSGRNLLSFDDYTGYDPEINVAGQSTTVRGFDFVEVPIPRSYSFGVTLGF